MARRQVQNYLMDIFRATGGQAHMGRVQQALADSIKKIDQKANWVFLGKTALINTEAPYSTGSVSVGSGDSILTGSGTSWDTTWEMRDIKFGTRQLAYKVASFSAPGAAILDTVLSGDASITAGSYVIYRARYPLPADCDPGRDQMLRGGIMHGHNGRIPKLTRPTHESRATEVRGGGNICWYTDDEVDPVTNRPSILIYPYPVASYELRLFYYRRLVVPADLTEEIELPEVFEELPIRMTTARIKREMNMQGWMQDEQEAATMMNDLYNRHAASAAYEQISDADDRYGDAAGLFGLSDSLYTFGRY